MNNFYPGDDVDKLISINIHNYTDFVIDKAVFTCGTLRKEIKPVENPIIISVTSKESEQFKEINTCFLDVYNLQGKKGTFQASTFLKPKTNIKTKSNTTQIFRKG